MRLRKCNLDKHDVEVFGNYEDQLRCVQCNHVWQVKVDRLGNLVPKYWQCPKGCNAEK